MANIRFGSGKERLDAVEERMPIPQEDDMSLPVSRISRGYFWEREPRNCIICTNITQQRHGKRALDGWGVGDGLTIFDIVP